MPDPNWSKESEKGNEVEGKSGGGSSPAVVTPGATPGKDPRRVWSKKEQKELAEKRILNWAIEEGVRAWSKEEQKESVERKIVKKVQWEFDQKELDEKTEEEQSVEKKKRWKIEVLKEVRMQRPYDKEVWTERHYEEQWHTQGSSEAASSSWQSVWQESGVVWCGDAAPLPPPVEQVPGEGNVGGDKVPGKGERDEESSREEDKKTAVVALPSPSTKLTGFQARLAELVIPGAEKLKMIVWGDVESAVHGLGKHQKRKMCTKLQIAGVGEYGEKILQWIWNEFSN